MAEDIVKLHIITMVMSCTAFLYSFSGSLSYLYPRPLGGGIKR